MNTNQIIVPKLRFVGFRDYWKSFRLVEIIESAYQGINTAGDRVIYSSNGTPILQSKHITSGNISFKDTRFLDKEKYGNYFPKYTPKEGDVLFANIGTIGPSTVVKIDKEFLIAWNILKIEPNEISDSFFIHLIFSQLNEEGFFASLQRGNATKFINKQAMLDIEMKLPTKEEQIKIGEFFKIIDNLINLQQQKITKLKDLKSAYLNDMFPKEGESVPRLRFAGFKEPWIQLSFGEVLMTDSFKTFLALPEKEGKYKVIQQGQDATLGYSNQKPYYDYHNVVLFGDHTLSLYKPTEPFLVATDGLKILKGTNKMDGTFLYYLLRRYMIGSEGYQRYYTDLKNATCFIINDKDEQVKISELFRNLDNQIKLQDDKLEKLKQMKQAYLNEMFV